MIPIKVVKHMKVCSICGSSNVVNSWRIIMDDGGIPTGGKTWFCLNCESYFEGI